MPGKAGSGFCCSVSPAGLMHSALFVLAKILTFCTVLRIKARPWIPKAFRYRTKFCLKLPSLENILV